MSQCRSVYTSPWWRFTGTFCLRSPGHEDNHRGSGREWDKNGNRVSPPTIKLDRWGKPIEPKGES